MTAVKPQWKAPGPGFGAKKRKPMPRATKPIPQMSPKRAAEHDEREEVRQATFARDNYRCVAWAFVPGLACYTSLECDEVQGRGREPGSHLDETKTQSLCADCHKLKTGHPRMAALLGLYGPDEFDRRTQFEEHPQAVVEALAEWARRKAQVQGSPVAWGGSPEAVARFLSKIGATVPAGAWGE